MVNQWLMVSLSGIEAFVAVAERRSFRAAAAHLERSPAAVSKAVAALERQVGSPLLVRTSRSVSLTEAGARYLPRCQTALGALREGQQALDLTRQRPTGRLRITAPHVLGDAVVDAMAPLLEHPQLRVDLRFTDRHTRLAEEGIDIALRIGDLPDSDLVARRLRTLHWATVASPAWVARHGLPTSPAALADVPRWGFTRPGGRPTDWVFAPTRGGQGQVVPLPPSHRIDHGRLLVQAARAGLGVAQVFRLRVEADLREGSLIELLPDRAASGPPLHALYQQGQGDDPRVRAGLDALADALSDL